MVLNTFRRILVAVVLSVGIAGIAAAPAPADVSPSNEITTPFTPPYRTVD